MFTANKQVTIKCDPYHGYSFESKTGLTYSQVKVALGQQKCTPMCNGMVETSTPFTQSLQQQSFLGGANNQLVGMTLGDFDKASSFGPQSICKVDEILIASWWDENHKRHQEYIIEEFVFTCQTGWAFKVKGGLWWNFDAQNAEIVVIKSLKCQTIQPPLPPRPVVQVT